MAPQVAVPFLPNSRDTEVVVIVDPYVGGRFLVEELVQRGWSLVAVRSSLSLREHFLRTWNASPFDSIVTHLGDVAVTAEALQKDRRICAVISGSEPGVELADELAERFGLRGNGTSSSLCRRDKFYMHERLRESGLQSCTQRRCVSEEEAVAFAMSLQIWPLVAKPCASMGADGVYLCHDAAALGEAVRLVLSSKDALGRPNETALVQEFLKGTEYAVDCVSFDGRHLLVGMWKHTRRHIDGSIAWILDSSETVPCDDTEGCVQRIIRDYAFECLTSLEMKNGGSHCKVMLSESHEPCLIELAPRMHDAVGPAIWKACAGKEHAQPHLIADIFVNEGKEVLGKLQAITTGQPAYQLAKHSMQIDLQVEKGGVLAESIDHAAGFFIRALPTYWSSRYLVEEGDTIFPTSDMSTSPGFIILVGTDLASVQRDAGEIRKAERDGKMYIFQDARRPSVTLLQSQENQSSQPVSLCAASRLRELEGQVTKLLSPMVSPAQSPLFSPVKEPQLPPEMADLEELDLGSPTFTLDGFTTFGDVGGDELSRRASAASSTCP